ncbi:MAG: SPOR domain-containing protein [Caldimicrobium sp.]
MDEKKFKFELSRLGLVFVILFALCLLVWTFILGVWIGTKIGGKPQAEELAVESNKELVAPAPSLPQNQTAGLNATHSNETANATPQPPQEAQVAIKKEESKPSETQEKKEVKEPQVSTKEATKKEEKKEVKKEIAKKEPVKKEAPTYQKKEVAQLASKVKGEETTAGAGFFALQVGAFSHKEKAEEMKKKAEKMGYIAQVKEVNMEGKNLYKVFVGKYFKREEAEQAIPAVKSNLGVERPFIVEIK